MTAGAIFRMPREDRYRHVRQYERQLVAVVDDQFRDGTRATTLVGELVSVARIAGGNSSDAAVIRRRGYYDVAIPLARVRSIEPTTTSAYEDHLAQLARDHERRLA